MCVCLCFDSFFATTLAVNVVHLVFVHNDWCLPGWQIAYRALLMNGWSWLMALPMDGLWRLVLELVCCLRWALARACSDGHLKPCMGLNMFF